MELNFYVRVQEANQPLPLQGSSTSAINSSATDLDGVRSAMISFTRFVSRQGDVTRQESLEVDNLNRHFDFRDCAYLSGDGLNFAGDPTLMIVTLALRDVVLHYRYFLAKDLKAIAKRHKYMLRCKKKDEMLERLIAHRCSSECEGIVYIFKSRTRPREIIPVQQMAFYRADIRNDIPIDNIDPVREHNVIDNEPETNIGEFDHLTALNDAKKLEVIAEWEKTTDSDNVRLVVCAACSVRERNSETTTLVGTEIDLTVLRNDELPEYLQPRTYNFIAYDRAILNAKGLKETNFVSEMTLCKPCAKALKSGIMPRLALANWLYYGRENLPENVANEFNEASMFERMLISRARCNSICCKFNASEGEERGTLSHLRKGIRGNIMVAPLDALRMHKVLPPDISEHRDTMSAVVVGNKMPSRATISKLGPVLVRKSRIRNLLGFLMENNPHYAPGYDLSYSQRNLDAIHDSEETPEIPRTVAIGQLASRQVVDGIDTDYTPRNEDEFIEEERTGDLVMENVGYTEGDDSPEAYKTMKLLALERCLSGKPFVASGTGGRLVADFNNPSILSWLFPHLDPWGIGGFHEPRRRIKISMKEQLSHLLKSDNVQFERDPEFAFVFYNVIRKAEVSRTVRFRVPKAEQARVVNELKTIDLIEMRKLAIQIEKDPKFRPVEYEHKQIMKVLKSVSIATHSLPGSNGYKMLMRSHIRAIINGRGSPTLFVTINPSDVDNPLVRIFSGEELDLNDLTRGEDMDAWRRKVFAAKNPSAAAQFFDFMIRNFIKVILKYGEEEPGLYGTCTAYYGTVEAQGKGTLHCHMLIWLRGHLPPQVLRDRLVSSEEYKQVFVRWLESIIKNEFPAISEDAGHDPERRHRIRARDLGEPHPGAIRGPSFVRDNFSSNAEYWHHFKEHLIRLLNEYNWHEHTETCWKYLKNGEAKTDGTCRMRMDGVLQQQTDVDPTTGHFQLRRLHPWISSYTDVVTFVMKCNMNIQFIGSGDAAKAFLYYLTDYVTKPSLALHAGLAALSYAIQKFGDSETNNTAEFNTLALTKTINGVMGRQEISHQQVMSYLVGGGDHYTSEKFQNLNLRQFMRHLRETSPSTYMLAPDGLVDDVVGNDGEETVLLTVEEDNVSVNNQVLDYVFRPSSQPFDSMCLYDFVAQTSKTQVPREEALTDSPYAFSSWSHPQRASHRLRVRSKPVLPVILGPSLPNRNGSSTQTAKELWSEYVIILFKPWRRPHDLRDEGQTWEDAYASFEMEGIRITHRQIIANMELLSDGADLRFTMPKRAVPMDESVPMDVDEIQINTRADNVASNNMDEDLQEWRDHVASDVFRIFEGNGNHLIDNEAPEYLNAVDNLEREVGKQVSDALTSCLFAAQGQLQAGHGRNIEKYSDLEHGEEVMKYREMMKLKRKRVIDAEEDEADVRDRRRQRRVAPQTPFVTIEALPEKDTQWGPIYDAIVKTIVVEMNLADNAEQLEAFLTVAKHASQTRPDQLLMFISGMGGTGKSHVIKSIVKLFERLRRRDTLLLGAPTGSAAILIGGSTLHSLILESPTGTKKKNVSILSAIWKNISYLIIDEVSMVGASFLSRLSNAIRQGKGDDYVASQKIFGGINVIFVGDMCQLKPPRQRSLYAKELTKAWSSAQVSNEDGISALNGIYIWRQINKVTELVKNCRHAGDPVYSDFLSRLRIGKCLTATDVRGGLDDYTYLQPRLLSRLKKENPVEFRKFWDAPFIVGSRQLRDILNARLSEFHANRLRQPIHVYHSKDFCKRTRVPAGIRDYLWSIESKHSRESYGRLPLFEGMKVMVTENIAFDSKVVNGTEGVINKIIYEEDEDGQRYATVVYVHVQGIGFHLPGLEPDVVPIFPSRVQVEHARLDSIGLNSKSFTRLQLPLMPAYAYTDFKSQGRTLQTAIIDIVTARGQGVYVMLSRVTSLSGLAILRWFPQTKVYNRLPEELRLEMKRLNCRL